MNILFYIVVAILVLTGALYIYMHHHGKKLKDIVEYLPNLTKFVGDIKSRLMQELSDHRTLLTTELAALKDKIHDLSEKVGDKLDGSEDGHWDKDAALQRIEEIATKQFTDITAELRIQVGLVLTDFKTEMLKIAQNPKVAAIEAVAQEAAEKLLADATSEAQKIIGDAKAKLAEDAKAVGEAALKSAVEAASTAAATAATKVVTDVVTPTATNVKK